MRVVFSCTPGHVFDTLNKRKYSNIPVVPLNEAQRKSFILNYLALSSKKLEDKHEFTIAQARQTENPRFLQSLLDDIALFGEHDDLERKIQNDLAAQNTSELYEIVIERMEHDFDKNNKGIVNNLMSFIWASRRGLYLDTELKDLLMTQNIDEKDWEPFFVSAEEKLLADLGGQVSFSNNEVKRATQRKFIKTEKRELDLHKSIAMFFQKQEGISERKIEELPYQLEQAKEYDELCKVLSDLRMFDRLYTDEHKFDLLRYWRSIEKKHSNDR